MKNKMKQILKKIIFFLLLLATTYIILFSLMISHYLISDFYYEKLININGKQKLQKKDVEDILYFFKSKKVKIENHMLYDIIKQRDNLKDKKYYIEYSLLFINAIDIIYDGNKKAIWIFSSYE